MSFSKQDYSDWCYECRGLGDDYSYDEDGELIDNCSTCWVNHERDRIGCGDSDDQ